MVETFDHTKPHLVDLSKVKSIKAYGDPPQKEWLMLCAANYLGMTIDVSTLSFDLEVDWKE